MEVGFPNHNHITCDFPLKIKRCLNHNLQSQVTEVLQVQFLVRLTNVENKQRSFSKTTNKSGS